MNRPTAPGAERSTREFECGKSESKQSFVPASFPHVSAVKQRFMGDNKASACLDIAVVASSIPASSTIFCDKINVFGWIDPYRWRLVPA